MIWKRRSKWIYIYILPKLFNIRFACSDDFLQGPVEELDLGSDEDDDEPQFLQPKHKKSKQHAKPAKIIPTGSDASSADSEESEDDDGPITMGNMEARSRALDAKAAIEADLDAEEMQLAALGDQNDDEEDIDMDGEIDDDGEVFQLPTSEEREEEKKAGGPDVHVVQRRMRECVRVLGNFKKMAAKGRSVTQTVHIQDIVLILFYFHSQVSLGIHRPTDIGHYKLLWLQRISCREVVFALSSC